MLLYLLTPPVNLRHGCVYTLMTDKLWNATDKAAQCIPSVLVWQLLQTLPFLEVMCAIVNMVGYTVGLLLFCHDICVHGSLTSFTVWALLHCSRNPVEGGRRGGRRGGREKHKPIECMVACAYVRVMNKLPHSSLHHHSVTLSSLPPPSPHSLSPYCLPVPLSLPPSSFPLLPCPPFLPPSISFSSLMAPPLLYSSFLSFLPLPSFLSSPFFPPLFPFSLTKCSGQCT